MNEPIEQTLDELIPDWREYARRRSSEGATTEQIVTEFKEDFGKQIDGLLDLYNDLGKGGE